MQDYPIIKVCLLITLMAFCWNLSRPVRYVFINSRNPELQSLIGKDDDSEEETSAEIKN